MPDQAEKIFESEVATERIKKLNTIGILQQIHDTAIYYNEDYAKLLTTPLSLAVKKQFMAFEKHLLEIRALAINGIEITEEDSNADWPINDNQPSVIKKVTKESGNGSSGFYNKKWSGWSKINFIMLLDPAPMNVQQIVAEIVKLEQLDPNVDAEKIKKLHGNVNATVSSKYRQRVLDRTRKEGDYYYFLPDES